jgi:predicted DNA-binding antitoxin AbrB/MazE fold protein
MELEGVVQNGVIVPQGECSLPEGTKVRIVPNGADETGTASRAEGGTEDARVRHAAAFVQSIVDAKGSDQLPDGYDFLEALNANRGPDQRPLFSADQKGKSW